VSEGDKREGEMDPADLPDDPCIFMCFLREEGWV